MRTEKATFTNMCMVYDGDRILVQNRRDSNWPGIAFPGGHVKPDESFVESTIREVREETGLDIDNLELCGVKQFTTDKDGRYIVFLYRTNSYRGEVVSSDEGEVFWLRRDELNNYTLSDGFSDMLKVFTESINELFYYKEDDAWNYKFL